MPRVENPIHWIRSKRALSDNPIAWLRSPQRHYRQFEEKVSHLSTEDIIKERARYNGHYRNAIVITGLGLGAAWSGAQALAPHVPVEVLLFSAGPVCAGICLTGITRDIVRESEKKILDEAIGERRTAPTEIFSASKPKEV